MQYRLPILFRLLLLAVATGVPGHAGGVEHVTVLRGDSRGRGQVQEFVGEVLVETADGGLLLATNDGAIYPIPPETIRRRTSDSEPLVLLEADDLAERLLAEMPPGFRIYQSSHYLICYNTTRTYAKWSSSLLERLQRSFLGFWKKRGCDVHEPTAPLVVVVFGDQQSYAQYAKKDLGTATRSVIGYYSPESNRIAMYDLTGVQSLRRQAGNRGSLHDVTALLSQPAAQPLVATIVHEATHQIAFNSGLQVRYADNPVWLSEGLAVYFETPDLRSTSGWRGIGKVNYPRLNLFRRNVATGKAGSLRSLIADDRRMKDPRTAVDAYAEAWAWNYFLIHGRPKQYTAYLKMLADKPRMVRSDPKTRLAEFRQHFGEDMQALEADFARYLSRL